MFLGISPKLNDIPGSTLHVGSEKFAFADGSAVGNSIVSWTTAPSWCPSDRITVKLTTAAPGAPRNLTAKAASTTQIDLAWDAPSKTGGSSITGYKIEVSTDGGNTWSDQVASQTSRTYSHTGLSTGNTRRYRVSAINTDGTGPASEEASATIAVPGAPGGLKATAGDKQVTLVWNAAPDGGSNSITKYRVRHAQGASVPEGANWTDAAGGESARTHTVTGLTNNREYTFEVQAVNGVGEGTAGTVKATPKRPAATLTYRFHVTNYSIKRGSNKVGERKTGGYVGVLRDDDPDTLDGSETVESDTTFTLTWNGRPTDELHPDNPTSVTIKAGQRGARFSLKAAADADDPKVYNQPVKADVVATLGSLTLKDQLVVFDDESLPTVSVSAPATVDEGDAFRVTATLTHRLDVDTSVPIVIHNPSNMTLRGIDGPYTSIRIPAGEISGQTGDIRKQNDNDEDGWGDLSVGVNGVNFKHWWSSGKQAKVRVTDDDTEDPELRRYAGWPRFYAGDVNATESGDPDTVTKMRFPVTLYPTSRETVTVDYRTEDGSAKAGVNYRAKSGTLTFAPREKTKTVEVDILEDGVGQHPTFRLVLTGPRGGGAEVRTYTMTGRIYDETPTFISYDESARESGNGSATDMTFLVKLKYGAENATYTVDYTTADGTARAGSDYTATSGTLTFEPGERGWQEVVVPILDDEIQDSGETFSLVLSNPTAGAQLHAWKSTVRGTILNDDAVGVAASFPESASTSTSHGGSGDRPQVIVAFSEQVASFAKDTPSVSVTGGSIASVQAHTEDGLTNAWSFTLAPEGDGEMTFTLLSEAACASGGICTASGTVLTQVPAALTLTGPPAAEDDAASLTASFPASRFASASHGGSDDRPQVVVAFSEAVASFTRDTPSVSVTGGSIASVRAHTEDGLENAWIFFLDPDGDGEVTFTLVADAACDAGGICTSGGTVLTQVPAARTLAGPADGEDDAAALTASFADAPASHDGSAAFTFTLSFSEALDVSYLVLRDDAFTVTGGSVETARRKAPPSNLEWEITVEPDGDDDVTITLAATTDCDATDAICTSGGLALTEAPAALSVPGPDAVADPDEEGEQTTTEETQAALTASFTGVPGEHGGPGAEFTFQLTFSEELDLSYITLRDDDAFDVTGGHVRGAQRRQQGSNVGWNITVEPSGWGDVAISLPGGRACTSTGAICTSDDRMLTNSPSATVQGPVALSVADANVQEGAGATLDFTVSLSRAATGTVTVAYATSDGTATAGADYTSTSGTLTFAPGETKETVRARIEGRSEAKSQLTLGGRQVALDAAWPTEEGALPASWTKAAGISSEDGFAPGSTGGHAGLGREGNDSTAKEVSMGEFLLASSFHMASAGGEEEGASGRWSMWGRGSRSSFSGKDGDLTLDGDVTTGLLGADYESGRLLAGVALALSAGSGSYDMNGDKGELESTLASVHPYLRYTVSERLSVWAVLGLGEGELKLEVEETGERRETDLSMGMAALGVRGALASWAGLDLAIKSDVLVVSTESDAVTGLAAGEAETRRLRIALEGSREVKLDAGVLRPSLEIGLRHDGGDAETGSGVELGGALRYAGAGGLTVEVRARGLIAHEEHDYEEWGVSATLVFSPGEGGRGLSIRAGSSWGAASGGAERLWSQRTAADLAREGGFEPDAASFNAEVGYGIDYLGGLLTPYTGLTVSGSGETYSAGGRFRLAEALTMSIEGEHRESDDGDPVQGVAIKGTMRW